MRLTRRYHSEKLPTVENQFLPLVNFQQTFANAVLFCRSIMIRTTAILLLVLISLFAKTQVVFKAIGPTEAVVEGESFQVQYVTEDAEKINSLTPSPFKGFRKVSGPEVYLGTTFSAGEKKKLRNTTYTLEAIRPGRYFLPGALATIDGKSFRSNDVWVIVISKEQAEKKRKQNGGLEESSMSFLKPGDDPFAIIKKNLFVKVLVDKKACFTGEPVVATFKLYSRLRSKSDIIKNPGFYGFTVQDMINLEDKMLHTEVLFGEPFDVHTIRQVQLYPLQPGEFTIDPMEIKSKVEFTRSAVSKKPEQEIIEGVFDDKDPAPAPGTEVFENRMSTEPVTITVKAVPAKNRPVEYNGATGRFHISAAIEKKELAKNEEGYYVITVKGKGNFSQLSAPAIPWPAGIEGFEPTVKDTLDKTKAPLEGTRVFRYAFVASNPGEFELPPVSFSFFDTDSNRYKTVSANSVSVSVSSVEKEKAAVTENKTSIADINRKASYIAGGIVISLLLVVLLYWATKRKEPVVVHNEVVSPVKTVTPVSEIIRPAYLLIPAADKDFYTTLQQCIFNFFQQHFDYAGNMNKQQLSYLLKGNNAGPVVYDELMAILQRCETGIYTGIVMEEDRELLFGNVKMLLEKFQIIAAEARSTQSS
jgi:hypothetical protein